ncbi:MAG TPA: TIR domain-containing protein [Candidatus Angelobacter sp.]
MSKSFDVFLCHSKHDKQAVERIARNLVQIGLQPWFDNWNLIPGEPWQEGIEEALDSCGTCAVFLGPAGIGPWQNEEVRAALDRRVTERNRNFRVIPVLLPGASGVQSARLPAFLARATWVEFVRGIDDGDALQRLVCGIRGVAPDRAILSQPEQRYRVQMAIKLSCTPEQFQIISEVAQDFLRKVANDATLTIKYVRSGSTILEIDCSPEAADLIRSLFGTGEFAKLVDFTVLEVSVRSVKSAAPRTMKCNDFLKELTDYLDGTASFAVRTELEEHLHWCHDCHVVMNTTKKTIEVYRGNQLYELPEVLRRRLHENIFGTKRSSIKGAGFKPKGEN